VQKTAENCRLTGKQERALLALLSEPTIQAAAQAAKISERALYVWLKEPTFAAAYRAARAQSVSQAVARLQQASSEAVGTLKAVMVDPEAPAPARVTAAKTVLEMALKGTEFAELQRRIAELEHAQDTPEPDAEGEKEIVSQP
jgi:hypothetical protein